MSGIEDVVNKFSKLDDTLKRVYSKVDPFLVVSLIFDRKANKEYIYTIEVMLKPGQDTNVIRQDVINKTGMAPKLLSEGH